MNSMIFLWFQFCLCSVFILLSGTRLSYYADIISEKAGFGKNWIGVLLLAPVTSLPELFNGLSAVLFVQAPDIAVGGILGSCVFNLFILSLLDLTCGHISIVCKVRSNHFISAIFCIVMLILVGIDRLLLAQYLTIGWISGMSLILIGVYFFSMYLIYGSESQQENTYCKYREISLSTAICRFLFNACIIMIAASWLPQVGEKLAVSTGLGQTFIGSLFIALSTSLPEVVVSFSSLKIGAIDMALGNILGSNLINICLLPVYDLFFFKGPLLIFTTYLQMLNIFSALIMTFIFLLSLRYRFKRWLCFDQLNLSLMLIYFLNYTIMFFMRR